jgi:class 3 adenylate cyclase/predicted ATPase
MMRDTQYLGAPSMDVVVWLRSLGLGKYEAAFRENEIDETVLPSLTHENLKELGVTALGHRLKLLDAIAALSVDTGAKTPLADATMPSSAVSVRSEDRAERRQITVMFSDLVGSTALSARMDPEDLRELISAYHKCVAEAVRRFGGFVAQYLGDGVLVYFGYPEAHEDDAERAVRAGLELVAGVIALKTQASLQTRVGIATGLVVVGDLMTGSGEAHERGIVGETPNLAARLQGIAEPNTVVIAETTRRLLGNLFELKDLGARDLKGVAEPVCAWVALRASTVESRFEALHPSDLTALVGRAEETELLLRRWSRAKSGEGQVVLISGEAGIGKSRLTAAVLESLAPEPHTRLRYLCSPQHTDSAFSPIIGQMERAAGFLHDDMPQQKLDKLDALLAQASTSVQDAALIAEMLSLPNDGRYPALELTPEQRRHKTLEALTAQIGTLSQQKPVLMIFEDAQWADPTSLEAFGRVVDRIRALKVLLLVTFRPEFDAPWVGRPYVTSLIINRLGEDEAGAMIDRVVGDSQLSASIRQDIIERTDGIPLFVEEMTKAVLEAGSEAAAVRAIAAVPSPTLAVPASLYASLMARLDRLGGPAKELAQIAAVIGREFSHALLASVVHQPEAKLESTLDRLIAAGLLFRQGMPPHATYVFKHALVQDAAYGTLLREPRRRLHARIAETIESEFAESAESRPELLARHWTEAGLIEKAANLWGQAGQRSLAQSALVEAAEQLTRALEQIATLPITPALRREQIQLQVAIITPLMHVKGYAAPETKAAAERARLLIEQAEALGEPPEDPLLLFSVLFSFWTASFVAFNGDAVRELANQFLTLAEKRRATAPLMIGHRMMGSVLHRGDFVEGRAHLDRAIALYDPKEHRSLAARFGQDVRVAALSYRSWALWMLGYPDAALADASCAIKEAREIGQVATLMYALVHACVIHIECGNYSAANEQVIEAANEQVIELVSLAEKKGAQFWKALGLSVQGCLLILAGRPVYAIQMITASITALQSTGSTLWLPFHLPYLARAYAKVDQFDDAWRCIDEAIAAVEATNERWVEAEAYRTGGEIALLSIDPDVAKAEKYFERALMVACKQQAKSWELRTAMSMARLWRDQGKPQRARELLTPIYGWFTEGFDTRDLKEAKVLLDTVS